ncbi:MAG: fructose-6-phosphate aldolase [Candidatus Omnitrophica bacterium]|nr:fructose-6-phosphate aldolase [Candidatus Omnitrophota bacterium]
MKFFIDTANIEEIKEANSWGILEGVTTNPTLVAREKKNFVSLIEEIAKIVDGPISAEVINLEFDGILEEARKLSKIHKNIVIKIPLMKEGLKAIKELRREGIKTNATLCFSPAQALLAAKSGATYVSPFVGRLDDIGYTGMELIKEIKIIYTNYNFKTEVIVASIRHPIHVIEAARIGADIATMPFSVMESLFKHPLTDIGIQRFLKDWQNLRTT